MASRPAMQCFFPAAGFRLWAEMRWTSMVTRRLPNRPHLAPLLKFKVPELNAKKRRLAAALTIYDLRDIVQSRTPRAASNCTGGHRESRDLPGPRPPGVLGHPLHSVDPAGPGHRRHQPHRARQSRTSSRRTRTGAKVSAVHVDRDRSMALVDRAAKALAGSGFFAAHFPLTAIDEGDLRSHPGQELSKLHGDGAAADYQHLVGEVHQVGGFPVGPNLNVGASPEARKCRGWIGSEPAEAPALPSTASRPWL